MNERSSIKYIRRAKRCVFRHNFRVIRDASPPSLYVVDKPTYKYIMRSFCPWKCYVSGKKKRSICTSSSRVQNRNTINENEYGVLLISIESIHINLQNNALFFFFCRSIVYEFTWTLSVFILLARGSTNQDNRVDLD